MLYPDYLKGKHDEKSSPIFMLLSYSYVCMHTSEKKLPSKNLSPWRYGQLKNCFLLWARLRGDADRRTAALVNHTVRIEYG